MKQNEAKNQPWYKSTTIAAINQTEDAYYIPFSSIIDYTYYYDVTEARLKKNGYTHKKTASHNGYIPAFYLAVLPYSGRFGIGVILVSHKDYNKVRFDYYIRGEENENTGAKASNCAISN